MADPDDEYMQEADEVQSQVFEEVFPILCEIDGEHPEHSAFFAVFVSAMHVLFVEGWTQKDLLREVREHHKIHLRESAEGPGPGDELH
jgi:hypothetical protein